MTRLILRDANKSSLPEWVAVAAECADQGRFFLTCVIDRFDEADAIARLKALGFDVWASEYKNLGWVAIKLDASH